MTTTVPADDRGLTLGVGLFETVLVQDGRLVWGGDHLARLARGCRSLGLPAPTVEAWTRAAVAAATAAALSRGRAALRVTWTGGSGARGLDAPPNPAPRLLAAASPWSPPAAGVALATSVVRRNPTSPACRLKSLSYLDAVEARRAARAAGADEALMLGAEGELACAAAANLFWVEGDVLLTPALDLGVLDGIVRARVLAAAPRFGLAPREVRASPSALAASSGAFLTNSLAGAVPVSSLDGAFLPEPDPRVRALTAAFSPDAMVRDADEG